MKPSMSTLYFRELGPHRTVELFARHGWHYLELSECHAYDLLAQGDPARSGNAFRQFAADHGISFLQGHLPVVWYSDHAREGGEQGYVDIAPASDREFTRVIQVLKRWVELFSALGVQTGVLHMGGAALKGAGWLHAAILERRVAATAKIAQHAAGAGMTICLENLSFPNCGVETLEEIQEIITAVGASNVGICLDTGHLVMADLDCVDFILNAKSLLKALHIHDNIGSEDDHVLPYERETIPWDRVLAALGKIAYTGLLNLELPSRPAHPMPVREAKLDYARSLASYMSAQASYAAKPAQQRQGSDDCACIVQA